MTRNRQPPISLLLVEDVDRTATVFESVLRRAAPSGSAVVRANDVDAALSYLATASPDCAVIDIDRADRRGFGLVDTIATRAPHLALVALCDSDDDRLGVPTAHAGPIDVLSRRTPDGKALLGAIHHAMQLRRYKMTLDDVESIARVGSWSVDLATDVVTWSDELYRLLDLDFDHQPGYDEFAERIHPDDRAATVHRFVSAIRAPEAFAIEYRVALRDGSERWVDLQGRVDVDVQQVPRRLFGTVRDITENKQATAALVHQQLHDQLTGLPNRYLLLDRLKQALARIARTDRSVGVIHVDVDRFNVVNDHLGFADGDRMLVAIAARLQTVIRPEDTLARVSGDEFIVLCEGLTDENEAIEIADRICVAMTDPFDSGNLVISVSAGVAIATHAIEPATLLGNANTAMYRAKRSGRARTTLFTDTMRSTAVGRLDTETLLRSAIADGELRLHYQPVVSLADGRTVGHEALVRWMHPTRGLIGPDEFITIAEECGLIVPLGAWVLHEACLQAKRFHAIDPSCSTSRWRSTSRVHSCARPRSRASSRRRSRRRSWPPSISRSRSPRAC